jgi:hypothetical protein
VLGLGNTLSGGIVPAAAVALTPAFADTKSLDFDGSDDQVEMLDFEFINENISISWWCTRTSTSNNETIFHALNDPSSDTWYKGFYISTQQDVGWKWYLGEDAGSQYWGTNTGDIGFNSGDGWHHFVMTIGAGPTTRFQSVTVLVYMDGSLVHTSTGGSPGAEIGSDEPLKLQIGARHDTSANAYTGNINDLAFFDTVLDADAVAAMYNSGDPTDLRVDAGDYDNSSNLTGYWWMGDEDSYPTITDRTSNGNDGTMTNMVEADIESDVPS